jgi:sugar O-acyltransferase (sialic acid O-acetyltransferase NeuD family)
VSAPNKLVIVGDSLFAEIAHEYFEHDSEYDVVAFAVEEAYRTRDEFRGLPVLPFESLEDELDPAAHSVYAAITYAQVNRLRQRLAAEAKAKGFALASYVSSRAFVWRNVELGEHVFIFEDNTIQPFVTIGDDCVLWSGNHIGHHARIGDHCFITSHVVVSGHVRVGSYCFIGVNATLRDDISIGDANVIGAGALIMKSTRDGEVYAPQRDRPHRASSDEIGM